MKPTFIQLTMMELLPEELKIQLPKLYSQEGIDDQKVYIKYFFPAGNWTWFVIEGEPHDNDFLFFGYVIGLEREWGYFTLKQLEEININHLTVERAICIFGRKNSAVVWRVGNWSAAANFRGIKKKSGK